MHLLIIQRLRIREHLTNELAYMIAMQFETVHILVLIDALVAFAGVFALAQSLFSPEKGGAFSLLSVLNFLGALAWM